MTENELVDMLSVHADHLKDGVDLTTELVAEKPADDRRALEALLALARRVRAALAPVEPRPAFVSDLKAQLGVRARKMRLAARQTKEIRKRQLIWAAAGLGGMIYLVGLMLVGWRLTLALVSLIAGLLGGRMARASVPKTRPTR